MKKIAALFTLALILASCSPRPEVKMSADLHPNRLGEKTRTGSARAFRVTGKVILYDCYCGGDEPSQEMLEQITKPRPLEGKKFYLRKGPVNDVNHRLLDSVVTDEKGSFSLSLTSGQYTLLLPEQKDNTFLKKLHNPNNSLEVTDENCLRNWLAKGFLSFTVAKAALDLPLMEIHRHCFQPDGVECVSYNGPMPP